MIINKIYRTNATNIIPFKLPSKPIPNLKGKTTTLGPITLDSSNSSKSDFNKAVAASLKVVGFSGSVDATYSALVSKELQLVQLWIEPNDVKRWINASPKALDNLRNYGGDARVVHTLFVVTTAVFASSFTGGVSYDLDVNAAGIVTVTSKGGSSVAGKDVITLAPGMCLAYGMLKLDWGKGKDFVEDLNVDEVGMK